MSTYNPKHEIENKILVYQAKLIATSNALKASPQLEEPKYLNEMLELSRELLKDVRSDAQPTWKLLSDLLVFCSFCKKLALVVRDI